LLAACINFCLLAFLFELSECYFKYSEQELIEKQLKLLGVAHYKDSEVDSSIASHWDRSGESHLHKRSRNRKIVYELRPNTQIYVPTLRRTIRTNSDGFRDHEYKQEKSPGEFRILAVGDSVTFGWTISSLETWPKRLEVLLNKQSKRDGNFEVRNMGIGGYNVEQEVEVIVSRGFDADPDMILLAYVFNDDQIGVDAGLWRHFTRSDSLSIF